MRYLLSFVILSLPSLALAEACPDTKARAALALASVSASASCECGLTGICTCQHCGCAIQVKLPAAKPVLKPAPPVVATPVAAPAPVYYTPDPTYYTPTYSPVSSYGASFGGGSCGPGGCGVQAAPTARVGLFGARRR